MMNYTFHPLLWILYSMCFEFCIQKPKWVEPVCVLLLMVPDDIKVNIVFQHKLVKMKNFHTLVFHANQWYYFPVEWVRYIFLKTNRFFFF